MRSHLLPAAIFISFVVATQATPAKIIEEVIRVPVKVSNAFGKTVSHEVIVTLFHDDRAAKPWPILLLNHGRSVDASERAAMGRAKYTANSVWFARLGFLVAVPTRVGYGETGGEDVEDSGDCGQKRYSPVYEAAVVQSLAVLSELRKRLDVSPDRAVVVGQSFGGATAVALAARHPAGVQLAINFAGGGGGNPETRPENPCGQPQLKQLFKGYGETARMPTLWIYTENDKYFGAKLPREWFEAFSGAGGQGEFEQFPADGQNGHGLFTRHPAVWQPRVLDFLRRHGYSSLTLMEP